MILARGSSAGYDSRGGFLLADIELAYGPGGTVAVLVHNLKSLAFKAKLQIDVRAKDDELENAIRLHLRAEAGLEASVRLQKMLRSCYVIFSKREAELSADLDESRSIVIQLQPFESRDDYGAATQGFYEMVHRFFETEDPIIREAVLEGACWNDGRAELVFAGSEKPLSWA